jgi:hypothetical protein
MRPPGHIQESCARVHKRSCTRVSLCDDVSQGVRDGWMRTGHGCGQAIPKAGGFEAATLTNDASPRKTQSL